MAYLLVGAIGIGLSLLVWLPWARRRPLVAIRSIAMVTVWGATGLGLWVIHELSDAAAAGAAVGESFAHIVVH